MLICRRDVVAEHPLFVHLFYKYIYILKTVARVAAEAHRLRAKEHVCIMSIKILEDHSFLKRGSNKSCKEVWWKKKSPNSGVCENMPGYYTITKCQ